jgi:hypothetical protein
VLETDNWSGAKLDQYLVKIPKSLFYNLSEVNPEPATGKTVLMGSGLGCFVTISICISYL